MPALKYWDVNQSAYVLLTPGATTFPFSFMTTLTAPSVASSPYQVNHNLGTSWPLVQMWDAVTGQMVQAQVTVVNTNSIQISVAVNMPNNINVIVLGSGQAPVPISPADYASKSYVDARTPNLPPAVTSGTGIQSFTDALGDVWVAAVGVRSGNWARARDVLHCKLTRTATWTSAPSATLIGLDTVSIDAYGMKMSDNTGISLPVAGIYRTYISTTVSSTAAGQWCVAQLLLNATSQYQCNIQSGQTSANTLQAQGSEMVKANAGDIAHLYNTTLAAYTGQTGINTSMSVSYLGTG